MKKTFQPTAEMIRAAENLFVAMAHEQTVRPIVEGYQKELLAKFQFRIADRWASRLGNEVILDPKRSYLMSEEDFAVYDEACHAARKAAGLNVENEDHCPLLVAENLRRQAEAALLKAMSSHAGLESIGKGYMPEAMRQGALKLIMSLLAPFVRDARVVLGGLMGSNFAPKGV